MTFSSEGDYLILQLLSEPVPHQSNKTTSTFLLLSYLIPLPITFFPFLDYNPLHPHPIGMHLYLVPLEGGA